MSQGPEVIDVFAHSKPPVSVEKFCLTHLQRLIDGEVPTPVIKRASEAARAGADAIELGEGLLQQRRMLAGGVAYRRLAMEYGLPDS